MSITKLPQKSNVTMMTHDVGARDITACDIAAPELAAREVKDRKEQALEKQALEMPAPETPASKTPASKTPALEMQAPERLEKDAATQKIEAYEVAAHEIALVPVYVISFRTADDRRKIMINRLQQHGLSSLFIDAIDGKALSDADRQRYTDPHRRKWLPRVLSAGAIGCSLSHFQAWERLLSSDKDYALILEDDAMLAEDASDIIKQLTTDMTDFDIISIHHRKNRPILPLKPLTPTREVALLRYNHIGGTAYLISRKAAKRLLDGALPITYELDIYINRWWQHGVSNVFINPPIAEEDGRASTIGYQTKEPYWQQDRLTSGLYRVYNRVVDSLKKRLRFRRYVQSILTRWHKT